MRFHLALLSLTLFLLYYGGDWNTCIDCTDLD